METAHRLREPNVYCQSLLAKPLSVNHYAQKTPQVTTRNVSANVFFVFFYFAVSTNSNDL